MRPDSFNERLRLMNVWFGSIKEVEVGFYTTDEPPLSEMRKFPILLLFLHVKMVKFMVNF